MLTKIKFAIKIFERPQTLLNLKNEYFDKKKSHSYSNHFFENLKTFQTYIYIPTIKIKIKFSI